MRLGRPRALTRDLVALTTVLSAARHYNVTMASRSFHIVLAARETRGFIKLVADSRTNRLLGAHILATEAGEMIQEPTLAIRHGITIEELASAFHPYLTLAEGIKLAAQDPTDLSRVS